MDTKDPRAVATKLFEKFFRAEEFDETLAAFHQVTSTLGLGVGGNWINHFYPVLRQNILHNGAQQLFRLLDERRKNPVYNAGRATAGLTTLVVGCGPCGLRTAIEAQLMGARVVMLEKRNSFTRNNVLHIWPFVIEDLKMLGCKVFFPKFCTGSMNHISIRRLQAVLVKVALVLGVEVHLGTTFASLVPPSGPEGAWRVSTEPSLPEVERLALDFLVGAEGKRVTVPGFPRKEFRGKLAIAITANFVNNNTTAEAVVEEISGVAFVYKQDFFNALYDELGIALENIVYYKDETHYFVMTTKKHSLLARDVLKKDYKDPVKLLRPENVDNQALLDYIRDTCDYCTDYQLPNLRFAVNHRGEPDVALFDFTSMFAARNSVRVRERHGKQLLSCLVGDGLLEPFWPTGTGCARGFLGAFDACWAMRNWASQEKSVLQIIAEREATFKLLPQTTPENISKEFRRYTIDPGSRYTHVDFRLMSPQKVLDLYESDRPDNGWRPPVMDNKRMAEVSSMTRQLAPPTQQAQVRDDPLARLERRMAAAAREQAQQSTPADYLALRSSGAPNAIIAPDKPSIRERVQRAAEQPSVGRLTEEARSVLNPRETITRSASEANKVGRLTEDALSVLTSSGSTLPRSATETKVGRLSEDALSALTGGSSAGRSSGADRQVGRLTDEAMSVLAEPKKPLTRSASDLTSKVGRLGEAKGLALRPDDGEAAAERRRRRGEELRKEEERRRRREEEVRRQTQQRQMQQPRRPPADFDIVDTELDDMLVQLETDDEFQRLSDNEKMAWLESLFYLDTKSGGGRGLTRVSNTKSLDRNLKINRDGDQAVAAAAGGREIRRAPPVVISPPKEEPTSIKPSQMAKTPPSDVAPGVNANLVSLAQSFFANDPKSAKQAKPTQAKPTQTVRPTVVVQQSAPKPFRRSFGEDDQDLQKSSPRRIESVRLTPTSPVPERAFFEPSSPSTSAKGETDDEQSDLPGMPGAPAPPPKSDHTKAAMLRLMARTTDILKNK